MNTGQVKQVKKVGQTQTHHHAANNSSLLSMSVSGPQDAQKVRDELITLNESF